MAFLTRWMVLSLLVIPINTGTQPAFIIKNKKVMEKLYASSNI